ncbi:MAG: response regulator [Proteobacteria bacterium]|nr:response regulator [Pseudomonadota bacterium]MBU1709357.1 response regulator [Pseudomonadota bacterium]
MSEKETYTPKVLFVDDEANILKALRRLFMEEDIEVFTATSGEEGLGILKENEDIGLIVSDQRMPEMNGVEFLEKARKIAPMAIRIVLTGYADVNAAIDAINRGGAMRYINKPWKDDELVLAVKEALGRYKLVIENKRLGKLVRQKTRELKKWSVELEIIVQEQTMELQNSYDKLRELNTRQKNNFNSTILAFSKLLELRDPSMRSHAENVADLSVALAENMNLSADEIENIRIASLLHDIGKVGTPDLMLIKDVKNMTSEEQVEYHNHPVRGQAAIDIIEDLREIGGIIRHHHESFDGRGFPDGLKKDAIPLGARIIAVADYVDNSVRKFQGDSGVDHTINEVKRHSGKIFDPQVVSVMRKPVRAVYKERLAVSEFVEIEVSARELRPGMILANDATSGTGLLLLKGGMTLDAASIEILRRYYSVDPTKTGIFVLVKRES